MRIDERIGNYLNEGVIGDDFKFTYPRQTYDDVVFNKMENIVKKVAHRYNLKGLSSKEDKVFKFDRNVMDIWVGKDASISIKFVNLPLFSKGETAEYQVEVVGTKILKTLIYSFDQLFKVLDNHIKD